MAASALALLAGRGSAEFSAGPIVPLVLERLLQGGRTLALLEPAEVGVELSELGRERATLLLGLLQVAQEASHIEAAEERHPPDEPGDGSSDTSRLLSLHGL